jgi:hypothetical protein
LSPIKNGDQEQQFLVLGLFFSNLLQTRYGAVQEEPGGGRTRQPHTEGLLGIETWEQEALPEHGGSTIAAAACDKEQEKGKCGGAPGPDGSSPTSLLPR